MNMGQLWFSLGSGVKYTYEQQWGEHVYRIESDGETARVLFDGVEKLCHACRVRLITDLQGNLLDTRIIE